MSWFVYALISAVAAAATAILAKLGVEGVPSTLATAIRTVVVTVFAWAMVVGLDQQRAIPTLSRRTARVLGVVRPGHWRVVARVLPRVADGAGVLGGANRQAQSAVHHRVGDSLVARVPDLAIGGGCNADGDGSVTDARVSSWSLTVIRRRAPLPDFRWAMLRSSDVSGSNNRCLPKARSRARSACASHLQCASGQRSGRRLMRVKRRAPISCRHGCRRKEPLHSDQRAGRLDRRRSAPIFGLAGTISGTIEGTVGGRVSRDLVYT